jgi:hypothetical protein
VAKKILKFFLQIRMKWPKVMDSPDKLIAEQKRMDVLLQNSKTAQYLTRDLHWTAGREDAFVFISSGEAIDFAFAHRLANVQLVLFFRDLRHSLIVPFQPDLYAELRPPVNAKLDRPQPL